MLEIILSIVYFFIFVLVSGYFHSKMYPEQEGCVCHDPQYCQCETTKRIIKAIKEGE